MNLVKINIPNLKAVDLSPFQEPVITNVKKLNPGFMVTCQVKINFRWDTECKYLETNRIFGHKGNLTDDELQKEFVKALSDIQEKRLWVFQANHGLLDKGNLEVRFKK